MIQVLGYDFFCLGKKYLVFNLVGRNLKIKYRRSVLGFFWTILTPMAMTAVYYFVFSSVLKVKTPYHHVFLLAGVMHWSFVSQSILEGMESIVGSAGLVTKVPVPLQVFPMVGSVTNFITLLLSMPVLFGVAMLSGVPFSSSVILLPFYWSFLFLMVYGLSIVLAYSFVLFRDLRHIMSIGMTIWLYATPVVYDETMIPPKYGWILYVNPFGLLFSHLHSILIRGEWPHLGQVGFVLTWGLAIVAGALIVQRVASKEIVEQI